MARASEAPAVECAILGWPADEPVLELDWRRFAYAGKFGVATTGKAVLEDDGTVVAAVAFDADRTDPDTLVLRYVTVREDRQAEGLAPRLLAFTRRRAVERGYERVRIAVNTPHAFVAAYRAGFRHTGATRGAAELDLAWPVTTTEHRFRSGLDRFAERDLDADLTDFLDRWRDRGPPDRVRR